MYRLHSTVGGPGRRRPHGHPLRLLARRDLLFRRNADGTFAAGQQLKDRHGKVINVGSGSAAFAVDWDGDGRLDLLVGNVLGEVYLLPNESKDRKPALRHAAPLEAAGQPIKVNG